ncbi:ketopantoate reductase family protein [Rhizobium sp. YIM 134829]|uniref:ketopantoate reductase family protein n=1 Tax=Rhizobium sp. YIM 134829 TaxID=3390453 RepID=UPI003977EC92
MMVAIFGGGAVGPTLAASLAGNLDHRVVLLLRGGGGPTLRSDGLRVEKPDGSSVVMTPDALQLMDSQSPSPLDLACNLLFLVSKAYQVVSVLKDLISPTEEGRRPRAIVLLQNGWALPMKREPGIAGDEHSRAFPVNSRSPERL